IIRTLQRLGLQSAVVYHEVDAQSPAVALADHAIKISGRTPVSSYLDGDQIIAAALSVAAGAIHPGYGFLSENAVFARAVEAAGLIFVGPSADVIELMGDKIRARNFVARNGFPVAPSAIEETPSPALSDDVRKKICEAAAGIARAAGYRNAGTVEFIYGRGEFYFLEMNTRLQVEHPVTEMTTGLDLVAEQLGVSAGRPLP